MYGNKMNTTRANKEMNDIDSIMTYVAINKMSSGTKQQDAVEQATQYILSNFKFAGGESMLGGDNTYFIPRIYNNDTLSDGQIRLIESKATAIKEKHLEDFDMFTFQSEFEDDDKVLNEEMLNQAKENGVWVNNADGSGIVFAIPFPNGELALVENKKGELLELKFDDGSHILPTTDIRIDLEIYEDKDTSISGAGFWIMANIGFGLEVNKYAKQTGFDQFQTDLSDVLLETAKDAWKYNPVSSALRLYELEQSRNVDEELIPFEELNKKYKDSGIFLNKMKNNLL